MIETLKKVFKDSFTESDGTSYCIAKITGFIAVISYLGNITYTIYLSHMIDPSAFGTGLGIVLGGCGALIAGKQFAGKDQ